jgi:AraC-like DNA-binding protein
MGLVSISMALSAFYWYADENYSLFYKLDIIETPSTLLTIPVIYLYFKELTGDRQRSWFKLSILFIPPILFSVANAAGYLLIGEEYATAFTKAIIENKGNVSIEGHELYRQMRFIINEYTYSLLCFVQAVGVFVYAMRRLLLYRRRLRDFFSNVDDKDMKHHWAVLWGILAVLILTFIVTALGYALYIKYDISVSIFRILYAVIYYYICYHVSISYYSATKLAEEFGITPNETDSEEYDILETENSDTNSKNHIHLKFLPKFNQVIYEDKVFLQKNLRVDEVAALVGTNRTYISRILKDEYNCSFWEFINRKRIEYAKERVLINRSLTVEELADLCGFSHGSTFSRAFRQCEQITFKEWQEKLYKNFPKH